MILDQLLGGHCIDLERLVAIEREVAEGEQVEELGAVLTAQVQVLADVEEQHEVVLVLVGQDDGAYVFDLVVSGLLPSTLPVLLEGVDVVGSLHVDAVLVLPALRLADGAQLLGALRVHHDLVAFLELGLDLWRHQVLNRLNHCRQLSLNQAVSVGNVEIGLCG